MKKIIKPILIAILFLTALFLLILAVYNSEEPDKDLDYNNENQTQTTPSDRLQTMPDTSPAYEHAVAQIDINNPRSCIPCHKTIFDEWKNSFHRYAHDDWLFRVFMFFKDDKPGIPWCENCHLSESTLEVEPLKQPVSRRDAKTTLRLEDGIDCASCHRRGKQIVGKHGTNIGCKAVGDANFGTPKYCGGCHSSFLPKTLHEYEEWELNPKPVNVKKTCVQCHMPNKSGSNLDGSVISKVKDSKGIHRINEKTHKQHNFYAGHDLIMLKSAFSVSVKFEDIDNEPFVIVRITNEGTGHHFPTGTAKRRVNIFVSVEDANGQFIGGGELAMCKPKPGSDMPSTQVEDGGWQEFSFGYDVPKVPGGKARVIISYKHYAAATPEEEIPLYDKTYSLPN